MNPNNANESAELTFESAQGSHTFSWSVSAMAQGEYALSAQAQGQNGWQASTEATIPYIALCAIENSEASIIEYAHPVEGSDMATA